MKFILISSHCFPPRQSSSMEFLIYENAEYEWNEMKEEKECESIYQDLWRMKIIIIKMWNYDERLYADGEVSHRISVIIFMIKCYNVVKKGKKMNFSAHNYRL